MIRKLLPYIVAAFIGSATTILFNTFYSPKAVVEKKELGNDGTKNFESKKTEKFLDLGSNMPLSFSQIANEAIVDVVHIKAKIQVKSGRERNLPDFFRDFFGEDFFQPNEEYQQGAGSGVIISSDGYIVTNYHVVQDAQQITVAMHNNQTYDAQVVGVDPSTDLALIKISVDGLSFMEFGSSDEVNIGDWVLAVGNPFNLSSTVTAGIVSAKARSINILRDRSAIESFIQTDAAVNPGNSGGALVNLDGRLIGINTAIASPTGSYAGYSFAIPSNIVIKVVEDLKEFGIVQRAYIGVSIREMNADLARQIGADVYEGVLIDAISENSGAEAAGLKANDIIVKINNEKIKSTPELLEAIGRHRPGDVVVVIVNRKGSELKFEVTLKNKDGEVALITKNKSQSEEVLGAVFEDVTDQNLLLKLNITGGVQLKTLTDGKLKEQTSIKEGFVITKVNKKPINSSSELLKIIENTQGGIMLEGIYPNERGVYYYAFGM